MTAGTLPRRARGNWRWWIGWSSLLIASDQIAKAVVRTTLLPGSRLPLVDNVLFITFIPNYRGVSWFVPDLPGWFPPLFLALRLASLLLAFPVYDFYNRCEGAGRWAWIALVAVSAGIAGNLLDDLFTPYTTDFIQLWQSPSANFADLFCYAGIGALAIEWGIWWKQHRPGWHGFRHFLAQRLRVGRAFVTFLREYVVRRP